MTQRKWILRVGAVLAVAATSAAFLLPRPKLAAEPALAAIPTARLLPVATHVVRSVPHHSEERHYTGEVRAGRAVELGFQLAGELRELRVAEGTSVEEGEVLAVLDTRRLKARRAGVAARLSEARAQLDEMVAGPRTETIAASRAAVAALEEELALARTKTERRRDLYARDAVSAEERDEAAFGERALAARLEADRAALEELENGTREEHVRAQRARVEALEAELDTLDVDLEDSELRAPFAGTVAAHHVDAGAVLTVGQPLLRLVEDRALEAWIGVPPDALGDTRSGSEVPTFELTLDGRPIEATLRGLLPEIDEATRTRIAIFDLRAEANGTRSAASPGRTVRLTLETRVEGRGFWVPAAALVRSTRGLWALFVAVEDEASDSEAKGASIERREVELLHTAGDRAFVRGTLFEGDAVLVDGVHRVVPGQRVEARVAPDGNAGEVEGPSR